MPVEAIRILTLNGARIPGEQNRIRSVAPERLAERVVIREDPVGTPRDPQRTLDLKEARSLARPG